MTDKEQAIRALIPAIEGLRAARDYLAWAEADVPPGRTFDDWHDPAAIHLRAALRALASSPVCNCDAPSGETAPPTCPDCPHARHWPVVCRYLAGEEGLPSERAAVAGKTAQAVDREGGATRPARAHDPDSAEHVHPGGFAGQHQHGGWHRHAASRYLPGEEGLRDGPPLVFSTSPAPDGIDTDCMFLASPDRISVHITRKAINAQVARAALAATPPRQEVTNG